MALRSVTPDEIAEAAESYPSKSAAARALGLPRTTFRDRLRALKSQPVLPVDRDDHESPEVPVIERDYSSQSAHCVFPLGDVHKGSGHHNARMWRQWLALLTELRTGSLLGTGDFFNSALKDSKSESYDEALTVREARHELTAELEPVADRIDLLMPGNHEARIYRAVGDCPVDAIALTLGVPYVQSHAYVVYQVGQQRYTFYIRHGTGGGQVGARANRLARQADAFDADVYVSGHTHNMQVFPVEHFLDPKHTGRAERHRRYFVASGSFLRYEPYAAVAAFAPTMLGAPLIWLSGREHRIHVVI